MREWGRMPTDDEKLKVRTAGVKDSGKPRVEFMPLNLCHRQSLEAISVES